MILSFLFSCVETPDQINNSVDNSVYYVLCEGIWGFDNSSISKLNLQESENNYFEKVNSSPIGDMAQNIIKLDSTYLILVAGSGFIIECDKDLKVIRRYDFKEYGYLKNFKLYNKNTLLISDLDRSELIFFDLIKFVHETSISTGPAPEDIEVFNDKAFVANSAKGEILDKVFGARKISVIDLKSKKEIKKLLAAPNTTNLLIDSIDMKLYASYPNFRWRKDSIGGILEYDLNQLTLTNHWKINCFSDIKLIDDKIFFLNENGLLSLNPENASIDTVISNNSTDIWYEFDFIDEMFVIYNAKQHTTNGDVIFFDENFTKKGTQAVGLNPRKIIKIFD